jgi:hypothetical protein
MPEVQNRHAALVLYTPRRGLGMETQRIELLERTETRGPSGGIRAGLTLAFFVDGRSVELEIDDCAMRTRDGQMSNKEIEVSAEEFLRMEAERSPGGNLPPKLRLRSAAMDVVRAKLGLRPRFGEGSAPQ